VAVPRRHRRRGQGGRGEIYRRAYARYERHLLSTLPAFRSDKEEASFRRGADASNHLAEHLHEAGALVLFLMPKIDWTPVDDEGPMDIGPLYASVYPAVQNFMLAARGLGIGTALTTVIRILDTEVREALGIPDRFEIAALVPMGRPSGRFGVAPRKPAAAVTHWNRYGTKRS